MKLAPIGGLDLVIDGDLRTVRKLGDDRESTLVLVRGGAGSGKTMFASHAALYEAAKRGGDVIYTCLELLPTELAAQLGGIKFSGADSIEVVTGKDGPRSSEHPRVFASIIEPAIATELSRVLATARARGFVPCVLVVDSLAEGYGLASPDRALADSIAKLAAEEGIIVILVEETTSASVDSLWPFVADVVFELAHRGEGGTAAESRSLMCTKGRFGRTNLGPHELRIRAETGVRIHPRASSYRSWAAEHLPKCAWRDARWSVLEQYPKEREVVLFRGPIPSMLRRLARDLTGCAGYHLDLELVHGGSAEFLLAHIRDAISHELPGKTTVTFGNLDAWEHFDEISRVLPPFVELAKRAGLGVLLYDSGDNKVARHLAQTVIERDGPTSWRVESTVRTPTRLSLPSY